MAIQLDKILSDIAKEKALHPNNGGTATKQEQEEAWQRIGRLNKLSVHESRSIFIVLQKKYDQEKIKPNSSWKLFNLMQQIHQEQKTNPLKQEDEQIPLEEVEEYEMLEVQEQEDEEDAQQFGQPANSTGSHSSDGESPSKSLSSSSPEKEDKPLVTTKSMVDTPRPVFQQGEEKKLLNTLANTTPKATPTSNSVAAVLQKKGITVKKTPSAAQKSSTTPAAAAVSQSHGKAPGRTTIQLPDSLKRKLSEEYGSAPAQKKLVRTSPKQAPAPAPLPAAAEPAPASASVVHTTTAQLMQVKKERESNQTPPPGINIITIPAASGQQLNGGGPSSSTAATVASTSVASTNGYSPHLEELDFKSDIIFESKLNNAACSQNTHPEIINLGNFDNSLPPTFFKNLCNSSRHEALGLYVANVMNRISGRAAAKLELGILRAIVDVQSDELEQ